MSRSLKFINSLILGILALIPIAALAQVPADIQGRGVVLTITGGTGQVFANGGTGTYLFLGGATGNMFGTIGIGATHDAGEGTYSYTKLTSTTARVNYDDSISGIPGFIVNLTSTSATTGTILLTNSNFPGNEVGTYRLYNGIAPGNGAGYSFDMTVVAGAAPLPTSGAQSFDLDPSGTSFFLQNGSTFDTGSATYTKSNTYASALNLAGTSGLHYSLTVTWDTATTGAYLLGASGAFQAGTFVADAPSYFGLPFQNGTSLGSLNVGGNFLPTAFTGIGGLASWTEQAVADINGDGIPDLIFQNGSQIAVLELDSAGLPNAWVGIGDMGAGGWILHAAADLNGDGQPELIFETASGDVGALSVNTSGQPVSWHGIGNPGSSWKLHGAADLTGDGQPELLFQNGTEIAALSVSTTFVPLSWHVIGTMNSGWNLGFTADINGDGQSDLVFQNGTSIGVLTVNTSFVPQTWNGVGAMSAGWKLPADY